MRKIIFSTAFLALSLCATSCDNDDNLQEPPTPTAEITLSVSGGEAITIDGADVTSKVVIRASEKSDKPIQIMLKADDAATGQVAFPVNPVVLEAGETTLDAAVTFTLEGFPAGTVEKNIAITLASSTPNVIIGSDQSARFTVKGAGGKEQAGLTVTTNGPSFNTTNAAQEATITYTLTEALDVDLLVTLAYSSDSELKEITLPEVKIAQGATSTTSVISVGQGMIGVMKLTLATAGAKLDRQNLTFTFTKDADPDPIVPPTASIAADGSTEVSVNGVDITKTINLTLDKAATEDVTVNFTATDGGTLSASTVTILTGANSGTTSITFPASVYTTGVKKTVTVTATSTQVTVAPTNNSITYQVSGPASTPGTKQDLGLFFNTDNSNSPASSIDTTNDFWVYIRKGDGKTQEGDIRVQYTIEGFESSELWISGGGIEGLNGAGGWREATGTIVVKPGDNGIMNINVGGCQTNKSGKVTFTSDDATFKDGASSAAIIFNLTKPQ